MPAHRLVLVAALAAALVAACVTTPAPPPDAPLAPTFPSTPPPSPVAARPGSSDLYDIPAPAHPAVEAMRTRLLDLLTRAGVSVGTDPAVDRAAHLLARWDADQPPAALTDLVVSHAFARAGAPDHFRVAGRIAPVSEWQFDDVDLSRLAASLTDKKGAVVVPALAWDGIGGGKITVVAGLRHATLEVPVPLRPAVGTRIRLQGRLLGDWKSPSLSIDEPGRPVRSIPLGKGPAFATDVTVSSRGTWRFEIVGEGRFGPSPLLNLTRYVDASPPAPPAFVPAFEGSIGDAEARLFGHVNDLRRGLGLKPLQPDERLARIARAHCEEQLRDGYLGHVSPRTGGPSDRVKAARYTALRVGENIATATGPTTAHVGLAQSPAHLATMQSPELTHLGVGAVRAPAGPGAPFCFVELYATPAVPIDVSAERQRVVDGFARARAAAGRPACTLDPILQERAQFIATRVANDGFTLERAWDEAGLEKRARWYRVGLSSLRGFPLADVPTLESSLNPGTQGCGFGVAQGRSEEGLDHELTYTVITATEPMPDASTREGRATLVAEVRQAIDAHRRTRGLGPVTVDDTLQALVERAADETSTPQAAVDRAVALADGEPRLARMTLRSTGFVTNRPALQCAKVQLLSLPGLTRLAVAIRPDAMDDGSFGYRVLFVGEVR